MPKIEFTPAELKLYFTGKRNYYYCDKAKIKEQDMRVHADGIFPTCLIEERRPNEPTIVQDYRKKIFVPKTKPYFNKIESTLQKIRRSTDWNIAYKDENFDKIVLEENLQAYCGEYYPVFGSLTNWCFSLLLRNYLIDANAVALVGPEALPEAENKFVMPVVKIFNSCDIIDFVEDDYAVLENKVGCFYNRDGRPIQGKSFYTVTTVAITKYDQINGRGEYGVAFYFDHGLNELPVFKLGGIVVDVYGYHSLYESRISGILPEFNEALREYSDLQAAKVLHLYPERWEYTQNECVKCKGTGQRMGQLEGVACQVTCDTCQGAGYIASGPYSKMLIRPASADQLQAPTPPAGFVEKDVEIIKVQEQSVKDHIYYGLSSINFEFLAEKPLATSGIKTAMDGDEMNNTVHSIAEDLVRILDNVYRLIALYRYSTQYTHEQIEDMLPEIAVPEKYDILSAAHLEEQVSNLKKSNVNPAILNELEVSLAGKLFNHDPSIAEHVRLVLSLNPFAGVSDESVMAMLSDNRITKENAVMSANINLFVDMAIEGNPRFAELETAKQREAIRAMAADQIAAMDEAKTIIDNTMGGRIDPVTGKPIIQPAA